MSAPLDDWERALALVAWLTGTLILSDGDREPTAPEALRIIAGEEPSAELERDWAMLCLLRDMGGPEAGGGAWEPEKILADVCGWPIERAEGAFREAYHRGMIAPADGEAPELDG